MSRSVPRSKTNDYTDAMAATRRDFLKEQTGAVLDNVSRYSIDISMLPGNIENFIGVAQVPLGVAGPLLINGEHAKGEFYVPLATSEGTLVASYNRGMKLLYAAGGVATTVSDDAMQRAPVFVFDDAREAREFGKWITGNFDAIKEHAESSTRFGKLINIEQYAASRFLFLRFNFTTGDAAGMNMVSKATKVACDWIRDVHPKVRHYYLESNFATDKKASQINLLHTRGKHVTAEAVIPGKLMQQIMRSDVQKYYRGRQIINLASMLSGVNNNGAHSPNAITAMFIATGQDVANVVESSAAAVYAELMPDGDYYYSITIPSLIVATYGGGTGLTTQRECLELLGCYGPGNVSKLAEIVAATVLCGELSLGGAIASEEWVEAHDRLGRNRP
ncbi:MAG: hydroxymethylglutaryl-CoA reductase [Gammaproteobacteria bacterium]|nr:hydroxymethylglutaryl-CoA reductase [Gammaproteobacteria bacterium]MDH3371988.1 hydroxymethylglutaryl-CoA reductase [Gammaproteobacteria bacterium]MDH3410537.1 hydroxymethylglutaryl-CoA reductase [Gammaproteobacteria bacterium]